MISLIKVYKLLKWCFSECFKFMKKSRRKKWKQRYWVLAVCECNARGLYFKKNWWLYITDSDIEIIFIGLVAVHTLSFTVTHPPHSTYLLTMIHLCTCTQALYSMVFICMLLIWVLEKYEIGFTALQNYSNVEKRIPNQLYKFRSIPWF